MIIKKAQLANNAPIGARNTMRQIDKASKSHFSLINPEPLCLYLKCTIEHFLFDIKAFHQLMRALYAQHVVRPDPIGGQPPLDPATHKKGISEDESVQKLDTLVCVRFANQYFLATTK